MSNSNVFRRIFFSTLIVLVIGLALFTANAHADTTTVLPTVPRFDAKPQFSTNPCSWVSCSITETTVADFNPGTFYLAGMTKSSLAGGDGNGEVRLLTFGISQADWKWVDNGFTPHLFGHAAVQKNDIIYVSGGKNLPNGSPVRNVYSATIQADHSLSSWVSLPVSLPVALSFHGMVIISNTLVVVGGADSGGNPVNTVYTATINSDGTLSPFQTAAPLPDARFDFGISTVNGTIYVVGGAPPGGFASNTVFYATPDPVSGAITTWFTATLGTPTTYDPTGNIARLTTTSYNGRFYQIGGYDFDPSNPPAFFSPYVFFAKPDGSGNVTSPNFTETVRLPINLVKATSATFAGQLYVVGGAQNNSTAGANSIYSAIITPTGSLNDTLGWIQSPVLSAGRVNAASVMSNDGWLYVIGGLTGSGGTQSTLSSYDYGPTSSTNSTTYAPAGNYTSPIIDVGGSYTVTNISWNTSITASNGMSATLQYFCGNSPVSLTACSASASVANDGLFQTNVITLNQAAQYWQYAVNFVRGSVPDQTPVLNSVRFDYKTPYPPPDLIVTNIQTPVQKNTTQIVPITVTIKNQGLGPMSPIRRTGSTASPTLSSGTRASSTSYYWIELYIDKSLGSITRTTHGDCYTTDDWIASGPLDAGQTRNIIINNLSTGCSVPAGMHTFYAQVDVCDEGNNNAPWTQCLTNGHVVESNENNNISAAFQSIPSNTLYLPLILR